MLHLLQRWTVTSKWRLKSPPFSPSCFPVRLLYYSNGTESRADTVMESWWLFIGDKHNVLGYVTHCATWRWPVRRPSLDIDKLQRKEDSFGSVPVRSWELYICHYIKKINTIHIVIITVIMKIHIRWHYFPWKYFFKLWVCLCAHECRTWQGQKRTSDPLKLELQTVLWHPPWFWEQNPRAVWAPNCWATLPPQEYFQR